MIAVPLLLPRHRRLRALPALVAAYHLAAWSLVGQTLGGRVLGLRVVSVDGGPVSPAQAVIVSFVALILTLLFRPTGLFVPTPK